LREEYLTVATIPAEILDAVRNDDDDAFVELASNKECCFAVDWREEDRYIVQDCESILRTGRLRAEWVGDELFVTFGTKRLRAPLTESAADRHITLLTLNEALSPEFEVRMLYASVGNDTGVFVPLASDGWSTLEREACEVVSRRFHKLTTHPNTFTDLIKVPAKARPRPWWRFRAFG
jgi:hypothetical protein